MKARFEEEVNKGAEILKWQSAMPWWSGGVGSRAGCADRSLKLRLMYIYIFFIFNP